MRSCSVGRQSGSRVSIVYLLRGAVWTLLLLYLLPGRGGTGHGMFHWQFRVYSLVVITLIAGLWLGRALSNKQGISRTGFEVPLMVVFGALGLNVVLSIDPRRSLGALGLLILYALWFYLVYDLVMQGWSADLMVCSLLFVGGIVIIQGLLEASEWFRLWTELSLSEPFAFPNPVRIRAGLDHANILSCFINLLLPLTLVQLFRARNWLLRISMVLWIIGGLLAQLLTSSRAGWIGTAMALAAFAVLGLGVTTAGGSRRAAQWWSVLRRRRWLLAGVGVLALIALVGATYLAWLQSHHPTHGTTFYYARLTIWDVAREIFTSSPWHGAGLSTFCSELLKYFVVPPFFKHAHSVPMTVLAEGGLLGVLSLTLLCIFVARALHWTWRNTKSTSMQLFVAGGLASLIGFATHSLLDDFTARPVIVMTALSILALTLASPRAEGTEPSKSGTFHPILLVIPAVLLIVAGFWSVWALSAHAEGVRLSKLNQWDEAVKWFGDAVRRDDRFTFYNLQYGFALGVVASDGRHEQALRDAVAAYEEGIQLEPNYSLNHANMFALYWQAGQREKALGELRLALQMARYGIWDTGVNDYGGQVFRRIGTRPDLLPQVKVLSPDGGIITEVQLEAFSDLSRRYQEIEQRISANTVRGVGRFENGITLLQAEYFPQGVTPGDTVEVVLTWLLSKPLPAVDYTVFVQVRGSENQNMAQCDYRLVWGQNIPTTYGNDYLAVWNCTLDIPVGLEPGSYEIFSGLYDLLTMERLSVIEDTSGENAVSLGKLVIVER